MNLERWQTAVCVKLVIKIDWFWVWQDEWWRLNGAFLKKCRGNRFSEQNCPYFGLEAVKEHIEGWELIFDDDDAQKDDKWNNQESDIELASLRQWESGCENEDWNEHQKEEGDGFEDIVDSMDEGQHI